MDKVYADNPLSKCDIVAIGCIIYSIETWRMYNSDFWNEKRGPTAEEAPGIEGLYYREIVEKCWRNEYSSMRFLYEDFERLDSKPKKFKAEGCTRGDFLL